MRDYSPLRGLAAAGATVHLKSTTVIELLDDYPADFEGVWEVYPARPGDSKKAAHKAWAARIKAGATVAEMRAGAQAYAAYVKAMRIEPQFILQSATFFGPSERYAADWTPPTVPPKPAGSGVWWSTDEKILGKGRELGIAPRSGEYMGQFKARIEAMLDPDNEPKVSAAPPALPRPTLVPPPLADHGEQRGRKPEGIGALKDLVRRGPPPARAA
jgi:hypothetical protein